LALESLCHQTLIRVHHDRVLRVRVVAYLHPHRITVLVHFLTVIQEFGVVYTPIESLIEIGWVCYLCDTESFTNGRVA
jgi:hypothetical protein